MYYLIYHHISEITRKAASRFYFMRQLKKADIPSKDMQTFYSTCIRPTLEYTCLVLHNSLPKYLSDDLKQLQKRALKIIYPFQPYSEVLRASDLPRLSDHRKLLTRKLFVEVATNSSHKLHSLLQIRTAVNTI